MMPVIREERSYDSVNKTVYISREFADGSRDLLIKPVETGEEKQVGYGSGGAHIGFDKDGKVIYAHGRSVFDTDAKSLEEVEAHLRDESTQKSLTADQCRTNAANLKQEGRMEESEKELDRGRRLDAKASELLHDADQVRITRELEEKQQRQMQTNYDRDR